MISNSFKKGLNVINKKEANIKNSLVIVEKIEEILEKIAKSEDRIVLTSYKLYKMLNSSKWGFKYGDLNGFESEGMPILYNNKGKYIKISKESMSIDPLLTIKFYTFLNDYYKNLEVNETLGLKIRYYSNFKNPSTVPNDINNFFDVCDKGSLVTLKNIKKLLLNENSIRTLIEGVSGIGKVNIIF